LSRLLPQALIETKSPPAHMCRSYVDVQNVPGKKTFLIFHLNKKKKWNSTLAIANYCSKFQQNEARHKWVKGTVARDFGPWFFS
jgi:hypothetical protein